MDSINMNMKPKGFTLVELVIVIIIVGILSIVAVPIYNSYTKKAISSEAKALVGSVRSAQQVYLAQYDKFANVEFTTAQKNKWFGVDVSANKYFRSFSVTASGREGNNQYWNLTTICPDKGVTVYSSGSNYYPDMYGGITVYDKNGDIIEDLK